MTSGHSPLKAFFDRAADYHVVSRWTGVPAPQGPTFPYTRPLRPLMEWLDAERG